MASANLYTLLRSRFPADPAAPCLEPEVGDPQSYGALDDETARLGARLRALGVVPGERVVVQIEKSVRAVALYLACLRIGAVYVPLNTAYTPAEVKGFLDDALPRLFVCDPARRDSVLPREGLRVETLDAAGLGSLVADLPSDADAAVEPRAEDDLAAILYTSGTTGRSKGACLTHANLASNALALHEAWAFEPGDVLLHALPIFHAHGLFVALHTALLNGSRVLFLPRFDAARVAALLPRATVFMGVPTFYTRLLERTEIGRETCAGVRLFVSGSAPLLEDTHAAFEARTGHRILERYGMTETGMITSNPCEGERVAGTVGYALPGVEIRVVGDAEEPGGLEVRGPNVFPGYWRLPDKTREAFRDDGFFVTGDLARQDPDGRVTLVGRAHDLVISGGFNVYPKEVEQAIDALPGVRESAVFGIPHPDFGEAVTAVVVALPGANLTETAITEALTRTLARFKHPRRIVFADSLPRNAMGKVQKNLLRKAPG